MTPSLFQIIKFVFYRPEINFDDVSRNFKKQRHYLTFFCGNLKVLKTMKV